MPSRNHLDKVGKKKKKKWTEEAMERALVEVKAGRCTVRQAAKEFGVPKSSLGDRVSGRVTPGSRSGPAQLITSADEEVLVEFSLYMSKHGFPLTKQQLVSFASSIYRRQHRRVAFSKLGQTWWLNFRKRQEKNITIQQVDSIVRGRTMCVRKEAVDQFFHLLTTVMDASGLREKPHQIFNCNETGFQLGRKRVILPKSASVGYKPAPGTRDHISVLACFSAAGDDIPPFLIYSKAYPGGVCYKTQGPPDALYGWSDSGCINSDLFKKWFLKHFLLRAPKERPLLLIFDGHKSPLNLEVVEAARKENVILLCLPPHCSHILQPLDTGLFSFLKQRFTAFVGDGCTAETYFLVSKKEFSGVFKEPYQAVQGEEGVRMVKEGFRKCGIYPLNRFAINEAHLMPSRSLSPAAAASLSIAATGEPRTSLVSEPSGPGPSSS
ncbi:tigger transposable element-derived protein 1-like [Myripristis murdjan]|uniref:tigger transposable element-derived protein 1-like n=1 Tax=Myripristis murdjan TaxID=586833 RepID=UPI00117602F2|nr:tigger transposable element-derived protein 1-like [Myripristis murdjan]XP_029924454.1 tigger transposable element-derived protein 1-like [Myripristis murdjan]XP_029924456.1 tigger transposable element-derived protein 1-like [Myripristis murdjan]